MTLCVTYVYILEKNWSGGVVTYRPQSIEANAKSTLTRIIIVGAVDLPLPPLLTTPSEVHWHKQHVVPLLLVL